MRKNVILLALLLTANLVKAQTVPVTFHLDANNSQFQTVRMWHWPDYYDYTDADGDNVFELTLDLNEGAFYYHLLRDNGWGSDPHNPLLETPYPTSGVSMEISDPMISYLLPKDGDIMRENRIRADFAYSVENPPLAGTLVVNVNGNNISNPENYYDTDKRILQINNPLYLQNGENVVTVSYQTNKGSINRTSSFKYQPIKLMVDTIVYRMENILAWGRVMNTPYPDNVYMQCNDKVYEASVNTEGYFGKNVFIENGTNTLKVARSEAELTTPIDQMTINAELRHNWWVELKGTVEGTNATITATAKDIDLGELSLAWSEEKINPQNIGISGNTNAVSFTIPDKEGEYILNLDISNNNGQNYTARKMLIVKNGTTHFLDINERAPWMETMALYEVEHNYLDNFTFKELKRMLPHMKKIGLNAFRITPFVIGGFISYDHFDIYPDYGSKEDLKDLVATAHQYGIKVLFDVPLSHVCPYHPFLYPNFLVKNAESPYYNFTLWEGTPGESDIVHSPDNGRQCVYTNLDDSYTGEYFIKLVEYWVEVFGVDGYRFDCGQESFLRSPDFMKTVLTRLRNINPNLFILQEGDNRADPDVNYYDFGDACYDWTLNSQWGAADIGLPGMFKETYTTDQFHELFTTGTPDSGLVMRYANSGYFDYLHNIYGWEQEKTAFAIVSTAYGLPSIFQGEEVGGERANGSFDYSDPLNKMSFYTRLIKMKQSLLGNYPEIKRLNITNSDQIYAYTSKHDEQLVLTVVNFTSGSNTAEINFSDEAFYGVEINKWFEIINEQSSSFDTETSTSINLNPWETKVLAININQTDIFPALEEIEIISLSNSFEITENGGVLSLIAKSSPQNSMDEIEWLLEGDTDLATISNGILTACGCGEGEVIVIARSVENPTIYYKKGIQITNQISGQVSNSSFDIDINNWTLWTPECNNNATWDSGQAKIVIGDNGIDCWSQFMANDYMTVEQGKSYRVSFDAYASTSNNIYCKVRENGENYSDLSQEQEFQLSIAKQSFSFEFTASEPTSSIGQIHFNFGGNNENIWIDNVSFCEYVPEPEKSTITFQVNMKNEEINGGVILMGSWDNWTNPEGLTTNDDIFSVTLELNVDSTFEYKFVNSVSASDNDNYETIDGNCTTSNGNRQLTVPEIETTLDLVCFGTCEDCITETVINSVEKNNICIYPNPTNNYVNINFGEINGAEITMTDITGRTLYNCSSSKKIETINLKAFESGILFINIKAEGTNTVFKLIKR